jgi:hypothetical protein
LSRRESPPKRAHAEGESPPESQGLQFRDFEPKAVLCGGPYGWKNPVMNHSTCIAGLGTVGKNASLKLVSLLATQRQPCLTCCCDHFCHLAALTYMPIPYVYRHTVHALSLCVQHPTSYAEHVFPDSCNGPADIPGLHLCQQLYLPVCRHLNGLWHGANELPMLLGMSWTRP